MSSSMSIISRLYRGGREARLEKACTGSAGAEGPASSAVRSIKACELLDVVVIDAGRLESKLSSTNL